MFRYYRVIFRQLVFITSPSYISVSIAAAGNTIWINEFHIGSPYILWNIIIIKF